MVKMPLALLATAASISHASGDGAPSSSPPFSHLRRRLSYSVVAGYAPSSSVADHCAIDLDQAAMERQLALRTPAGFANAKRIYEEGGNSKSYARITLAAGLPIPLEEGDVILGEDSEGNQVRGEAYEGYVTGVKTVKVRYAVSDAPETYVACRVGALVETTTGGCLKGEGTIDVKGRTLAYVYDPASDNRNGRTM